MPDEIVAEKLLTAHGKESFFKSIEEYIDAKIDFRTLSIRPDLNQEQVEERLSKATDDLKNKLEAIKISLK